MNTAEYPTQMGSPLWDGFTPGNDARVVFYAKQAGAIVPGNGLAGMRERLEGLHGSLRIDGGPGRGTRVEARVPLAANDDPIDNDTIVESRIGDAP